MIYYYNCICMFRQTQSDTNIINFNNVKLLNIALTYNYLSILNKAAHFILKFLSE